MLPLFAPAPAALPAPLATYHPATALPDWPARVEKLRQWQQRIACGYVTSQKEEALQAGFLTLVFGEALGYEHQRPEYRQLLLEKKTNVDGNGGKNNSLFGQALAAALVKLPAYVGEAASGVKLSPAELAHYRAAAQSGQSVRWPAFLSGSQKKSMGMLYLRARNRHFLFVIQSLTGRLIEEAALFGVDGQNEYEVLFMPNTAFAVLEVVDETDYTRIMLDEL